MERRSTDQRVMGIKKEHFNKGTIVTALVGVLVYMQQDVKEFIFNHNSETTVEMVKKAMAENNHLIYDPIVTSLEKNLATAIDAHGKTKLTDLQAIYLIRTAVGYQSIHKVQWLKEYLGKTGIIGNEQRIKSAIKAELTRQSSIYISSLNRFVHPKLGLLGIYVENHFPMEPFLNGVYEIALNVTCDDIENKGNDVMYLMLDMQNDLLQQASEEMRKL